MTKRFLERNDIHRLLHQSRDFTIRWRGIHILSVGTSLVLLIIAGALIYVPYKQESLLIPIAMAMMMICIVASILIAALHQSFKRITHVEFLSLIFASSARLDNEFIMILNRRGIVVYCDSDYDRIFGELGELRDFQAFLALDGLTTKHADALTNALMERKTLAVPFFYHDEAKQKVNLELSLIPLSRPNNFSILRAKRVGK